MNFTKKLRWVAICLVRNLGERSSLTVLLVSIFALPDFVFFVSHSLQFCVTFFGSVWLFSIMQIVRSTLSKGEWKYDETLDDCDYLREEIDEAYQIVERNKKAIEPLQGLKDQVVHYEKQIRQVCFWTMWIKCSHKLFA